MNTCGEIPTQRITWSGTAGAEQPSSQPQIHYLRLLNHGPPGVERVGFTALILKSWMDNQAPSYLTPQKPDPPWFVTSWIRSGGVVDGRLNISQ